MVPKPKAVFTPGQHLGQSHWDAALYFLHRVGMLPLLDILDVREVRTTPGSPNADPHAFGSIDHSTRAILLADSIPFPAQVLPSTLVHEAFHLYQQDIGILNDHKKTELMAYVVCAVFHFLNKDGIDVFHVPPGLNPTWPVAVELGQAVWG